MTEYRRNQLEELHIRMLIKESINRCPGLWSLFCLMKNGREKKQVIKLNHARNKKGHHWSRDGPFFHEK